MSCSRQTRTLGTRPGRSQRPKTELREAPANRRTLKQTMSDQAHGTSMLTILLQILATAAMAAHAIQSTIASAHANLLHWVRLVGMPLRLDLRPARIDKHARTRDTIVSTRHHTSTTENEACIHACNAQYRCYGPTRNCKTVRYRCFKLFEISGLRGRVQIGRAHV